MKMEQSVPKRRHIKLRRRGITQKKTQNITTDINKKRFERIGHVLKWDRGRIVEKIFESKPAGSRGRGSPRLVWLGDVGRSTGDER